MSFQWKRTIKNAWNRCQIYYNWRYIYWVVTFKKVNSRNRAFLVNQRTFPKFCWKQLKYECHSISLHSKTKYFVYECINMYLTLLLPFFLSIYVYSFPVKLCNFIILCYIELICIHDMTVSSANIAALVLHSELK